LIHFIHYIIFLSFKMGGNEKIHKKGGLDWVGDVGGRGTGSLGFFAKKGGNNLHKNGKCEGISEGMDGEHCVTLRTKCSYIVSTGWMDFNSIPHIRMRGKETQMKCY
jgi:hypothetical protein